MLQTVDADMGRLLRCPGGPVQREVSFPRLSAATAWDVQFVVAGQIAAVGNGAETGQLVLKAWSSCQGQEDEDSCGGQLPETIFSALVWNKMTDACQRPFYRFYLMTDTPAARALLNPTEAECEWGDWPARRPYRSAPMEGELRWQDGLGNTFSVEFDAVLRNEVIDGTEPGTPNPGLPMTNWSFIAYLTGGVAATCLDAQPVLGVLPTGFIAELTNVLTAANGAAVNAGAACQYQLQVSEAVADGMGIIATADDATRRWVKIL